MALRIGFTLLLAAGLAMAQRGGGGGGGRNSGGGGSMPMSAPRVEPLDQLTQLLKLNKDQKKDVKGIMDDGQKEAAPLRDELVKSRGQIATVVEAGKSQDETDQAVKSYAAVEAQMAGFEAKAFSKIFAKLDAEQKANTDGLIRTLTFMHGIFRNKNWNAAPTE